MGGCIAHPTVLLTTALEQRKSPWLFPPAEKNQGPHLTRGFSVHFRLIPKQWAIQPQVLPHFPARAGKLVLGLVPSHDYQINLVRELRQLQSPSYSLTWSGKKSEVLSNCCQPVAYPPELRA